MLVTIIIASLSPNSRALLNIFVWFSEEVSRMSALMSLVLSVKCSFQFTRGRRSCVGHRLLGNVVPQSNGVHHHCLPPAVAATTARSLAAQQVGAINRTSDVAVYLYHRLSYFLLYDTTFHLMLAIFASLCRKRWILYLFTSANPKHTLPSDVTLRHITVT